MIVIVGVKAVVVVIVLLWLGDFVAMFTVFDDRIYCHS